MDTNLKTYVIVKCKELDDQYECDADREPMLILMNVEENALKKFHKFGYEIYVASKGGKLKRIKYYSDY